jgi:hypothetical protein
MTFLDNMTPLLVPELTLARNLAVAILARAATPAALDSEICVLARSYLRALDKINQLIEVAYSYETRICLDPLPELADADEWIDARVKEPQ